MKIFMYFITISIVFSSISIAGDCDFNWTTLGNPNGEVRAIILDGNNIYVGGSFTSIGGITANRIAKWDGQNWNALIDNQNQNGFPFGTVHSIVKDANGDFFIGGNIWYSQSWGIVKWDGNNWYPLGTGVNGGEVYDIVVASDGVYAGGNFSSAGSVNASYVAKWYNNSWHALESELGGQTQNGAFGPVYALGKQFSSTIYVGGDFYHEDKEEDLYIQGLMIWRSSTGWDPAVSETGGDVYDIKEKSNTMYLAVGTGYSGWISTTYNGYQYSYPTSGTMNNDIRSIFLDNVKNHIYAGGLFTTANGNSANRVARWDGDEWEPLCSGVNNNVYAVAAKSKELPAIHWGDVYVGGTFSTAGGQSIPNLAKWKNQTIGQKPVSPFTPSKQVPKKYALHSNYPNPFNPETKIRFDLPVGSHVRLAIYNISGKLISEVINKYMGTGFHQVNFYSSELPSGIYLYKIEAGDFVQISKMILVK